MAILWNWHYKTGTPPQPRTCDYGAVWTSHTCDSLFERRPQGRTWWHRSQNSCASWQTARSDKHQSCTRKSARTWGITRTAYSNATLPSFFLFTICSKAPKTFPVLGSKANCQPAVRLGKTCRTASFFLQWQERSYSCTSFMGRPFLATERGGWEECNTRCTPCPSNATSITALAGGNNSRGCLSFMTSLARKSKLNSMTFVHGFVQRKALKTTCCDASLLESSRHGEREHRHRGKQEDDPWDADLADEWELDVVALMSGSGMVKSEHIGAFIRINPD